MPQAPNFDPIARPYRWLEYLTLGPILQRTRQHHLPALKDRTQALILGDGDGRFTAALLTQNPHLKADAVDLSQTMLHLLRARTPTPRLTTHHQNALTHIPHTAPDLIVTHFFLDCLTQPEIDTLIPRLATTLQPNSLWLLSDFRIPTGPLHYPARAYIRLLYAAFRLLTNLHVTHLPNHEAPMQAAGLTRISTHHTLFGLITTELWTNKSF